MHYHQQIRSMTHLPLFRVRSWNNGICYMSLYRFWLVIHQTLQIAFSKLKLKSVYCPFSLLHLVEWYCWSLRCWQLDALFINNTPLCLVLITTGRSSLCLCKSGVKNICFSVKTSCLVYLLLGAIETTNNQISYSSRMYFFADFYCGIYLLKSGNPDAISLSQEIQIQ